MLVFHQTSFFLLQQAWIYLICFLNLSLLIHRSSWPGLSGLCDAGLSPALLPQHHLRRHRQRGHIRPSGGTAGAGSSPPEETQHSVAKKCPRELTAPPASPAVPFGHPGPEQHASRRSGSLSWAGQCSRPLQLHTSGTTAAVWNHVPLHAFTGLASVILRSCSGCQVRGRVIPPAVQMLPFYLRCKQ